MLTRERNEQLRCCYIHKVEHEARMGDLLTSRELALNPGTTSGKISFFPSSFGGATSCK